MVWAVLPLGFAGIQCRQSGAATGDTSAVTQRHGDVCPRRQGCQDQCTQRASAALCGCQTSCINHGYDNK